jgi:hypothetical protein
VDNGPPPIERVKQEHELFGFFTDALSCLECAYFGLYVVGAFLDPGALDLLDLGEDKLVTPLRTHETYLKVLGKPGVRLQRDDNLPARAGSVATDAPMPSRGFTRAPEVHRPNCSK